MRRNQLGFLIAAAMTLATCGAYPTGIQVPSDPDAPVLQVRTEGGFAPIEWILGNGPTYTLLADGRLIAEEPEPPAFPAPLLPHYQVHHLTDEEMTEILDLVVEIGLPEMTSEIDDSASKVVADAGTDVVSLWDVDGGIHQYSVYALGLNPDTDSPSTAAFAALIGVLDQLRGNSDAAMYEPERVRVLAGFSGEPIDADFEDIRPWPLADDDPAGWERLKPGWACNVYEPEVLNDFQSATQLTRWTHPDPMMDAPTFSLLVRPLHPGEEGCEIAGP